MPRVNLVGVFVLVLLLAGQAAAELRGRVIEEAAATTIALDWDKPTENTDGTPAVVDYYRIYRARDAKAYVAYATILAPKTEFTDTKVQTGALCYKGTAVNEKGESARSNDVCFSCRRPPSSSQLVCVLTKE